MPADTKKRFLPILLHDSFVSGQAKTDDTGKTDGFASRSDKKSVSAKEKTVLGAIKKNNTIT